MDSETKPVLISGMQGFVGSNLQGYLNAHTGHEICGLTRKYSDGKKKKGQFITYQTLFDGNRGFGSYVHLAGKVYDMKNKSPAEEYFQANYHLTKLLFEHFEKDPLAEKFIFLSTIHVLTESPEKELSEDYSPHPVTPYGESKLKAEEYLMENIPEGKKVYILRPSMIHGPGNKGNLNLLYSLVSRGLPYPFGRINNRRSFVSVENLCFIIKELLENDVESGLYHIADDEPTYTHELVGMIAEATGKRGTTWKVPLPLLESVAKAGDYLPIPLTKSRYGKLTRDFIVSNRKIKQAIGKPLPVTSREGLLRTLNSFNR